MPFQKSLFTLSDRKSCLHTTRPAQRNTIVETPSRWLFFSYRDPGVVVQQDNAAIHRAGMVQELLNCTGYGFLIDLNIPPGQIQLKVGIHFALPAIHISRIARKWIDWTKFSRAQ